MRTWQIRGVGAGRLGAAPAGASCWRGRRFAPGLREWSSAARCASSAGIEVGKSVMFANQQWTVVGEFASGDCTIPTLGRRRHAGLDLQPPGVPVRHREARRQDGFPASSAAALAGDPRSKLDSVLTTTTTRQAVGRAGEADQGPGHGDRRDHGDRRGVRRAQHHVRRGRRPRARDRDLARLGFRGPPVVVAVMLKPCCWRCSAACSAAGIAWLLFQRLRGDIAGQQLQPGGVPVPRVAGFVVERASVGAGHRPGRRVVPEAARRGCR